MLELNIKKLMIENDLSITEISKVTGLSRVTINNLVNGKKEPKALQLETLYQLSSIFCVSVDELFKPFTVPYTYTFDFKNIGYLQNNEHRTQLVIPVTVFYNKKEILCFELLIDYDEKEKSFELNYWDGGYSIVMHNKIDYGNKQTVNDYLKTRDKVVSFFRKIEKFDFEDKIYNELKENGILDLL